MRQAAAAGAARTALRRARAHGRPRQRADPARRGGGAGAGAQAQGRTASRRSPIGYMHAYLDGKHERRTRDILTRAAARRVDHAVERGLARDPRVRALVDRRRQRLRPAGDGPLSRPPRRGAAQAGRRLPALPDHLGRRPRRARDRAQVPDPAGRVRPGRRRHPGRGAGAPVRPRQGAVVRHGRHHRQDLPDRRRRAAAFAHLRGRAAVPLPQGQRPAAAHPGDRDGRDRRRRRLDRLGRFAVRASMSARRAPAPSPAPRATAAAAPSPP